jgi:hypothetical protein
MSICCARLQCAPLPRCRHCRPPNRPLAHRTHFCCWQPHGHGYASVPASSCHRHRRRRTCSGRAAVSTTCSRAWSASQRARSRRPANMSTSTWNWRTADAAATSGRPGASHGASSCSSGRARSAATHSCGNEAVFAHMSTRLHVRHTTHVQWGRGGRRSAKGASAHMIRQAVQGAERDRQVYGIWRAGARQLRSKAWAGVCLGRPYAPRPAHQLRRWQHRRQRQQVATPDRERPQLQERPP